MRKRDKKTEKTIRETLTIVCEIALQQFSGFSWLTHTVNYQNFPDSLQVTCVYQDQEQLIEAIENDDVNQFRLLIKQQLYDAGINLNNIKRQINFDTEGDT
ncbi:hypothetical protein EDC56_3641 [Sinobacterium caligoides]|uniref:Fis family transcriptional regulator n=1 Tax=Sinobacterium caligoides TaxID=933926 RepID=A0A3N2DE18_9GAMM|nr:Fis family transcriptional regulator [Sinobacterium caligoides]ROR97972.1 hypothetical protein EDC56_3641 [Sinobacterium caligoides]